MFDVDHIFGPVVRPWTAYQTIAQRRNYYYRIKRVNRQSNIKYIFNPGSNVIVWHIELYSLNCKKMCCQLTVNQYE